MSPFARRRRVLAQAQAADGALLQATVEALLRTPAPDRPDDEPAAEPADRPEPETLAWQEVHEARWDSDTETLRVVAVGEWNHARPTWEHEVSGPGASRLLQVINERVQASIVLSRPVRLPRGHRAQVVARRAPHGAGELVWQVDLGPGVDPADADTAAAIDAELALARADLGL